MRYEFLLPYLPDYNPIELAFSAMKYCITFVVKESLSN
jgi:transposase